MDPILAIKKFQREYPDMRVGQILIEAINVSQRMGVGGICDIYDIPDEDLYECLNFYLGEGKKQ